MIKVVSKSKIKLVVDTVATKENIRNLEKFYEIVKNLRIRSRFLGREYMTDKKSLFRQGVYENHGLCVKLNPTA